MDQEKIIHPSVKDSRVMRYLNLSPGEQYQNTEEEEYLMQQWRTKYYIAKNEQNKSKCNSLNLETWRNAYLGNFNQLDENGKPTDKRMKAVRKLCFELVEGKINSTIPPVKMSPRYHADLFPVNATESLIRHEMDKLLSEEVNDEAEHSTCIDGLSWFKVDWNPFDNTHERSGNPIVKSCPVDTIFPQPGVKDYRKLEYLFEESDITVSQCYDLFNRNVRSPNENDIIPIVTVYFLNEDRYLGRFIWCEQTSTVIANDLEWGIRKRRECMKCHTVLPIEDECPVCGSKDIKYVSVKAEILQEDLQAITNPYRSGQSDNPEDDQNIADPTNVIPAGTEIPYYLIRQIPFVPYRRINVPKSIYGISEVELVLEDQDLINKFLNKAEAKSKASTAVITKLKDTRISPENDELKYVEVETPQEGQSIQVKQIMADIQQEVTQAQMLYDIAKSTVGITDTDQGKNDPSARSGKAKQLQMAASAQRGNSPTTQRNLAYSGVYELIFKFMLAYSDEPRTFVTLLPDGTKKEQYWSKYMFLSQDENGEYYYRDDFAWSVDTAMDITQDRASMWQLIDNDYINGLMGNEIDPARALKMYWQMKEQYGYPTAKYALAFLEESVKHLPTDVEQVLVNNPEAVQMALQFIQDQAKMLGGQQTGQQGGAREGAGQKGNNATHAANVEKTNNKNRTESGHAQTTTQASALGGMQGGTGNQAADALRQGGAQ